MYPKYCIVLLQKKIINKLQKKIINKNGIAVLYPHHPFHIEMEFGNVSVCGEGKPEKPKKNLWFKDENQQKI